MNQKIDQNEAVHKGETDRLQQENAALLAALARVQEALNGLEKSAAASKADMTETIAALRGEIEAVRNTLEATSKGDTQSIRDLGEKLTGLEKRLKTAEGDLAILNAFDLQKTQNDVAALQLKMKDVDLSGIKTLSESVEKLQNSVGILEKNPVLTEDEKARLGTLKTDLLKLTDDLAVVTGKSATDRSSLTTATMTIDQLLENLKTKVDAATVAALTEQIAKLQIALDVATGTISAETFTKRIAALEEAIYKLQNPRVDIALTQFVNAFVGTSKTETGGGHSGNLNPGAQTPFGMVSFGPDTSGSGQGWGYGSGGYYYGDSSIQFFSMTHLNGPGCRGQSTVAMQPTASGGGIGDASYSHANEKAEPGYYQVKFDNGINSEFTATTRTGMARFTFADRDKAFLIIDSSRNNTSKGGEASPVAIKLADDKKSVSGQAIAPVFCDGTWKQPVYFYATFDKPLKANSSASATAATLQFDVTDADKAVQVKIGISSVSTANARLNL